MRRAANVVLLALFIICYATYRVDGNALRAMATSLADGFEKPADKALALNHWVHKQLPTVRNAESFLWSRLRATPIQVLEGGGDCADKSRLLSTMLRELGIPATMVMLFDPKSGQPTHTVVEARLTGDAFMIVDPSFDLTFPNPPGAGYFGVVEMRRDPSALEQRLSALQQREHWPALCHFYPTSYAPYQDASTINWNKNGLTRVVHTVLHRRLGEDVYRLSRPVILEEPKLFVGVTALIAALLLMLIPKGARWTRRCVIEPLRYRSAAAGSQKISDALNTGPSVQHSR